MAHIRMHPVGNSATRLMWLAVLPVSVALACDRGAPVPSNVVVSPPAAPAPAAVASDSLRFEKTRDFDFDGDGIMETIHVVAIGGQWDSMDVSLTIRNAKAQQIWADTFDTSSYLGIEPYDDMTREAVGSAIRERLDEILSDVSFMPTEGNSEDGLDLRSIYIVDIAKRRHRDDVWEYPTDDSIYQARVRSLGITEDEYKRFEDDIMKRPMFRYYIGGETSTGITWSTMLGRFIETSMCC